MATLMILLVLLVLSAALWWAAYKRNMSFAILIAIWIGWNLQSLLRLLT